MKNNLMEHAENNKILLAVVGLIIIAFFGYGGYQGYRLKSDLKNTEAAFTEQTTLLSDKVATLENHIVDIENRNTALSDAIAEEAKKSETFQALNDQFQSKIEQVTGTVGTLQKLENTDPELLQKYSKVYFLNENYSPSALTSIDDQYLYDASDEQKIHAEVLPFLEDLFAHAKADGVDLSVVSAYRSFGEQAALKSNYTVIYGAGTANQFSADQGYSEHQLGTTIDFTTDEAVAPFAGFDSTIAYSWLVGNANKYGFILSYPKSNTFYTYEPWHWRFVGVGLAKKLHQDGKFFYDVDQRDIDAYLAAIFD